MKKRRSLFLLSFLCLASCAKQSYTGKYSFMLGRQGEDKIGVSINLTDKNFTYKKNIQMTETFVNHAALEAYDKSKLQGGEYFLVIDDSPNHEGMYYYHYDKIANVITPFGPNRPEPIPHTSGKQFNIQVAFGDAEKEMPKIIQDILKEGITGYYNVTNQSSDYGQRLAIGSVPRKDFIPGLAAVYALVKAELGPEIGEIFEQIVEQSDAQISPEIIEKFVVAYCNGSNLTLQIPVSIKDFQLQLTWYGLYIDLDPQIKDRLHSISDVYRYLPDILLRSRFYELKEHTEKFLRPGETELRKIALPGGDSIQGENRIGTHPGSRLNIKQTADEKAALQKEDIAAMNYHYSNEFANTFLTTDEKGNNIIGAITSKEVGKETKYYFYDRSGTINESSSYVTGYVQKMDDYGVYQVAEKVNINLGDIANKDYELGLSIKDVTKVSDSKVLDYDTFYQEPFTFRNQHDIRIGLSKESK